MVLTLRDVTQLIPGDLVLEFTRMVRNMRDPVVDEHRRIVYYAHEVRGFLDHLRQDHLVAIHGLRAEAERLSSVIEDLSATKH